MGNVPCACVYFFQAIILLRFFLLLNIFWPNLKDHDGIYPNFCRTDVLLRGWTPLGQGRNENIPSRPQFDMKISTETPTGYGLPPPHFILFSSLCAAASFGQCKESFNRHRSFNRIRRCTGPHSSY